MYPTSGHSLFTGKWEIISFDFDRTVFWVYSIALTGMSFLLLPIQRLYFWSGSWSKSFPEYSQLQWCLSFQTAVIIITVTYNHVLKSHTSLYPLIILILIHHIYLERPINSWTVSISAIGFFVCCQIWQLMGLYWKTFH